MELDERVAALERRIAALESAAESAADSAERPAPEVTGSPLWALESLKAQLGAFTGQLFEEDWADAAESFAALGHPVRLRLLREILGGRRTAAELAELEETGTTGQIYHHLRQLTGAGWLRTVGRGRYEVPGARVVPLLVVLTAARP